MNKSITFLVADNDTASRLLTEEILRSVFKEDQAIDILSTGNGQDAFELCNRSEVKLIITDIKLAEINGFELTKRVKKSFPNIPVIIQTGMITDDIEKQIYAYGADAYITKPVNIHLFSKKITPFLLKLN